MNDYYLRFSSESVRDAAIIFPTEDTAGNIPTGVTVAFVPPIKLTDPVIGEDGEVTADATYDTHAHVNVRCVDGVANPWTDYEIATPVTPSLVWA